MQNHNNVNAAITCNQLTAAEFSRLVNQTTSSNNRGNTDDYRNLSVADCTVNEQNLARAEFHNSKLSNVTFTSSDLNNVEFTCCQLENVTFDSCKMEYTDFNFAVMDNVRFVNCQLKGSTFHLVAGNTAMVRCFIGGIEMLGTANMTLNIDSCSGENTHFNGCNDLHITAADSLLHRSEFTDSTLVGTMTNCMLNDSDFRGSDCSALNFDSCPMRDVSSRGAIGFVPSALTESEYDDDDDFDFDFE